MITKAVFILLSTLVALTSVAPAEDLPEGFTSISAGASFQGWKWHKDLEDRWEITDSGVVRLREDQPPRERGADYNLWSEKSYRDFTLMVDWRLTGKPVRMPMNAFTTDGLIKRDQNGEVVKHEIEHAGDSGIYLRGDPRFQVNIWSQPMGSGDINSLHKDASLPVEVRRSLMPSLRADHPAGEWNRFVITMRGDRVTVVLNGETVLDQAQLPGVPEAGPIALQNHGDPIDFRNLWIREF
ncbi:MAG: 3-keto-disaccharide hydrolase [Acidobacteriota bacterium]